MKRIWKWILWVGFTLLAMVCLPITVSFISVKAEFNDQTMNLWQGWSAYLTFWIALLAALITWKEFRISQRPKLFVYMYQDHWMIRTDSGPTYVDRAGLRLENIGISPAFDIKLMVTPGIPWPVASHPAGEPRDELSKRIISYLYPKNTVDLLSSGREEFDAVAFSAPYSKQRFLLTYRGVNGEHFSEELELNLKDIQYIESKPLNPQSLS
jgi:hypothetical protein